jgi:hypothetical protein
MGGNSSPKEEQWNGNECFHTGINKAIMKEYSHQDATGTQCPTFGGRLKSVIDIRKPDQTNAPKQVEEYANGYKYGADHLIRLVFFHLNILPG